MVFELFQKLAVSTAFAAVAAGAGMFSEKEAAPAPAYGVAAASLEATSAARHAARAFEKADLNNDGELDEDEYSLAALVTAELALLNGFYAIDAGDGVETVAIATARRALNDAEKVDLLSSAVREFAAVAGDDERLDQSEYVNAQLEVFLANDTDRNAVLAAGELIAFGARQARLRSVVS